MASRNFNSYQALEKEVKTLYAEVAIGASGAPTLTSGLGVASVERDSAGVYTVTLEDKYVRLMWFGCQQLEAAAEDLTFQLESRASNNQSFVFQCKAGATETDPSDGSVLLLKLELKNSTSGE